MFLQIHRQRLAFVDGDVFLEFLFENLRVFLRYLHPEVVAFFYLATTVGP